MYIIHSCYDDESITIDFMYCVSLYIFFFVFTTLCCAMHDSLNERNIKGSFYIRAKNAHVCI